jgi:VanZ family protein
MAPARHRSSAAWLALAWAALILYASLFPATGWRWPPGQDLPALMRLPWPPWRDDFDLWANFLGYLPLGALLLVAARRSGGSPAAALALAVLAPSALSYATEVTQSFLPGRHPSLKDCAVNGLGAGAGALLGGAAHALGLVGRWHALRGRWFVARHSAGGLALLALWPVGLLFPAPVPLGLGQVGERLREAALSALEDVPWAEGAYAMVATPPPTVRLWLPAEALATALGLLGPCLVAYAIAGRGWRRVMLAAGLAGVGFGAMTLSTLLNFGPQHALAWLTPVTWAGLVLGAALALLCAPAPSRLAAGIGLVALTGLATLTARAPADPYFAQSLHAWEQGRFVHFHGAAQWVGWLWPYATMAWLLSRLASGGRGHEGEP